LKRELIKSWPPEVTVQETWRSTGHDTAYLLHEDCAEMTVYDSCRQGNPEPAWPETMDGCITTVPRQNDDQLLNQQLANRPVTLLKSEAQYSQSFGEGRLSGSACRAAAISEMPTRPLASGRASGFGLRALLSNQRSISLV